MYKLKGFQGEKKIDRMRFFFGSMYELKARRAIAQRITLVCECECECECVSECECVCV